MAGRQHDHKALLGKLLGDGSADPPAHADRDLAVVEHLTVGQLGVASIGLPLGGGPDHDGDLLTGGAHAGFLARWCWPARATS